MLVLWHIFGDKDGFAPEVHEIDLSLGRSEEQEVEVHRYQYYYQSMSSRNIIEASWSSHGFRSIVEACAELYPHHELQVMSKALQELQVATARP